VDAYSPASLPPITAIDVVVLQGINANRVDQYMHNAASAPRVRLDGAAAQRIADSWRALPPGEQARCHVPPYGLRFYSGDRMICEASVCWECNNIFGEADGRKVHFEFDAEHRTSQELLAELRRLAVDATPA
jgi:hypothetical protein